MAKTLPFRNKMNKMREEKTRFKIPNKSGTSLGPSVVPEHSQRFWGLSTKDLSNKALVKFGKRLDPSVPPTDGKCCWDFLPKEISDYILRDAYGRRAGIMKFKKKPDIVEYNRYEKLRCTATGEQFEVS
jgi:hypothetical protein